MEKKKIVIPSICLSVSYDDDTYVLRIIKSGWRSIDIYHVIQEYGDIDASIYHGALTTEQIKEKFGIDPTIENSSLNLLTKENPNDQTLGKVIRIITNKLSNNYE